VALPGEDRFSGAGPLPGSYGGYSTSRGGGMSQGRSMGAGAMGIARGRLSARGAARKPLPGVPDRFQPGVPPQNLYKDYPGITPMRNPGWRGDVYNGKPGGYTLREGSGDPGPTGPAGGGFIGGAMGGVGGGSGQGGGLIGGAMGNMPGPTPYTYEPDTSQVNGIPRERLQDLSDTSMNLAGQGDLAQRIRAARWGSQGLGAGGGLGYSDMIKRLLQQRGMALGG